MIPAAAIIGRNMQVTNGGSFFDEVESIFAAGAKEYFRVAKISGNLPDGSQPRSPSHCEDPSPFRRARCVAIRASNICFYTRFDVHEEICKLAKVYNGQLERIVC